MKHNTIENPAITISGDLLLKHGYRISDEPLRVLEEARWQKAVVDEYNDVKYFINITEGHAWDPKEKSKEKHNWWPSVTFDIPVPGKGRQTVKIDLVQWFNESGSHSQITIEEMETMIEQFFTSLNGLLYNH